MKWTLLLCGAALFAAGCASEQNPFATTGEFSYTYDLVPQPVPELTPVQLDKIEQAQGIGLPVSYTAARIRRSAAARPSAAKEVAPEPATGVGPERRAEWV